MNYIQRLLVRRPAWHVLAVLVALLGSGALAAHPQRTGAQPGASLATNDQHHVYLPLLTSAGSARSAVQFTFDAERATHAAIGSAGGVLAATAADGTQFALSIPPDALDFTEVITMTPVSAVAGLPLSGGLAGAVNLEPAGLTFYSPATLAITPATAPVGPLTIGFAFDGIGSQFHLRSTTQAPGARIAASEIQITMELLWIRPVGAGSGTAEDIAKQQTQPAPADPMDALDQALLDKSLHMVTLRQAYDIVVEPDLQRATSDPNKTDIALRQFDQWMRWVEVYGLTPLYADQIAHAKALLIDVLERAAVRSTNRCYEQKRPEEGFALLRWARYARKHLPGSPQIAVIEAKLAKCLTFKVRIDTWISETNGEWGWLHQLHGELVLHGSGGMLATGSGSLQYDAVTWIGEPIIGCTFSGSGAGSTFDAASSGYGLKLTPVSRTSPAVRVSFSYNPGVPIETKSIVCTEAPGGSGQRHHWRDYYEQMHDYERTGIGFTAQSTIVGVGDFEGWIYHHTGMGTQAPLTEETQIEIKHTPER
jgi:hypothetical protein